MGIASLHPSYEFPRPIESLMEITRIWYSALQKG
jgi:hypothetical protein